jgi:hypothetical protein
MAEVLVGFAGRESWETGIGTVDEGHDFWMLRSVASPSDDDWAAILLVCIVYSGVP